MSVYTKTGDQGETSLANGQRVPKTDARIEAYGTVDELNSWIGLLRAAFKTDACADLPGEADNQLRLIQNRLFNLGAQLSCAPGEWISEADVKRLELWIDAMQAVVPKQHAFLLPSGGECAARCHVCRTVCRRAERQMIALGTTGLPLQWINRLSDYLFVLARYVTYLRKDTEETWEKA